LNPDELEVSIDKLFNLLSDSTDLFGNKNLNEAIKHVKEDLLKKSSVEELTDSNDEENLGKSPELPDGDLPKGSDKIKETLKNNLKEFFGGDRLLR